MDSPSDNKSTGVSSCCHHQQGRNLVVCIDGTLNQFGTKNTNVIELYNLISKRSEDQKAWYNSGIGTDSKSSYIPDLYRWTDPAFAWSFKETILDAYQWLSNNYKEGDRIFLFGFSRGAYQVRVLSAMIDRVGLIHGNEKQIQHAFGLYENRNDPITTAEAFKRRFSWDVRVHFVGAWDTVSSIGIMRAELYPGTVDGMKHVCYFRHALALHERRVKYLPEYAYGGSVEQEQPDTGTPHTLEVWFAGTHSDIGGRNSLSAKTLCPPLKWMVLEATIFGLRLEDVGAVLLEDKPELIDVQESLTAPWWILEILPLKRPSFTKDSTEVEVTRRPHHGSCREILPGQRIHYSVCDWLSREQSTTYNPKASPPDFWRDLRKCSEQWVQYDLHSETRSVLLCPADSIGETVRETCVRLKNLLGRQVVCEIIISTLNTNNSNIERNHQVMTSLMNFLEEPTSEDKSQISTRIPKFLSQLLDSDNKEYKATALAFMAKYTNHCVHEFHGHKKSVQSTAFSADCTLVVSGSDDKTIQVWDVKTGDLVKRFTGHSDCVNAVAFSCHGDRVVSGSSDKTIRVWNVKTGEPRELFKGHLDRVNSVAFSPDGDHIVSGSSDKTVRIWDVKTREQLRIMKGHTGWVRFVAFYKNERVVSGSDDKTIRIWDLKTGAESMKPIRGHKNWVRSVAFSPNGDRLVSGSDDRTIRIWDMTTGAQLGESLSGHSLCVKSVAFSRDGKRVVSGSNDKTIRTWDVNTKAQLGELSEAHLHSASITSVTFSSDGERVVLGWLDGTVRIYLVPI